jgi:hypothetical protein
VTHIDMSGYYDRVALDALVWAANHKRWDRAATLRVGGHVFLWDRNRNRVTVIENRILENPQGIRYSRASRILRALRRMQRNGSYLTFRFGQYHGTTSRVYGMMSQQDRFWRWKDVPAHVTNLHLPADLTINLRWVGNRSANNIHQVAELPRSFVTGAA